MEGPRARGGGADIDLSIEKLVAGGDGLGRLPDGKAVFVAGVLPGERVRVRLAESRRDFARARLLEVLEPSPHRVVPPCPLAGPLTPGGGARQGGEACGGCDWMHIEGAFQVELKRRIVEEALRRTARLAPVPGHGWPRAGEDTDVRKAAPAVSAAPPGLPFGYRNRVQLHRAADGSLGYMAASANRVVAASACPIAVGPIGELLADPAGTDPGLERFTVFSDGAGRAVEGIDDDRQLSVQVGGRQMRFSVGCFFQSNLAALPDLVAYVEEDVAAEAGERPVVCAADLYSGVGLFAAVAAAHCRQVAAVEASSVSASFIRANVAVGSLEVFPMTVEQWIESGAASGPFDLVIADPPRAGLSESVRGWLAARRPRLLVYVSCGPVTLARDLGELVQGGFALETVRLFDFYPQTSHIEAVAVLSGT